MTSSLRVLPPTRPPVHQPAPVRLADDLREEQVRNAEADLWDDDDDAPRYKSDAMHALLGDLARGRVTVVGAAPGQGKTTFVLDTVDHLADAQARRVYVLGLEQQPEELRTKWACLRADVPAWLALERKFRTVPGGIELRARVAAEFVAQRTTDLGERVVFDPERHINQAKLRRAADDAHGAGCDVLVVDHIDRIEHGDGSNPFHELRQTVRLCTELADDYGLHLLVMSQLNRDAMKGDRLAKYQPPQAHWLFGGSAKEQEADVILGLHRPLKFGATADELKAARSDVIPVADVLEPGVMCVSCLKHRIRGDTAEGRRAYLRLRHGRLADLPERDRHATTTLSPTRSL